MRTRAAGLVLLASALQVTGQTELPTSEAATTTWGSTSTETREPWARPTTPNWWTNRTGDDDSPADVLCEPLAMPTGLVSFPEGGGAYQPNTQRCWVGTCAKKMLLVTVWRLDLESCCDRLELGWESPSGELFNRPVTGRGRRDFVFYGQHGGNWNGSGELRMDFSSDSSVQGQGFVVEWHCADNTPPPTTYVPPPTTDVPSSTPSWPTTTTPGGTTTTWPPPESPTDAPCEPLAMPVGILDFPEGGGAYQPNTQRCWVGTCAKKMLLLTVWQLDLEPCCDHLELEWESPSGELFKRTVTGSGRRDFVFDGQRGGNWNGSGELRMDFSSDSSLQLKGFVVEWHCADNAPPPTTDVPSSTPSWTTTTELPTPTWTRWHTPEPPTPAPVATIESFTCRDWGAHNCGTYQMKPFAGHIVCGETWRDCTQPLCCRAATTTAAPAFTCADWGAASCKSGVLRAHASRITCGATPSGCFESLCCAARAQAAPGGQATCGGWASRGGSCYPRRLRADADDVVCGADDFACTDAQCCTA